MDPKHATELREILSRPENKVCADCGKKNPDWASVPFGCCICLQCSGIHRSLGTHITFVQSLKLDNWTDENIAKMKVGGNGKLSKFLKSRGIETKNIAEKYNNVHARQYAKKLEEESRKLLGQKVNPVKSEDEDFDFNIKSNKFGAESRMPKSNSTFIQTKKEEINVSKNTVQPIAKPKPKQSTSTPNFVVRRSGLRTRPVAKPKRAKVEIVEMSSADFDDALDDFYSDDEKDNSSKLVHNKSEKSSSKGDLSSVLINKMGN